MFRFLFILLLLPNLVLAQHQLRTESKKAIKAYEEAMDYYRMDQHPLAERALLAAIEADSNFQNAYLVLAEVYWDMEYFSHAISSYEKGLALNPTFYPMGYYNKAKLERRNGSYEAAIASYEKYIELAPEKSKYRPLAEQGIKHARFAQWAVANPVDFSPVNLGPNINTRSDEYWPTLSADEQTLIITRKLEHYDITLGSKVQEDFFISENVNGQWQPMKNAGRPLNTPDNEGAQSISADGRYMVYTVCNRKGVIGRCDIFYSEKVGDSWTTPKNLGATVNSTAKETQPSLSADGRTLYFASNRPGGKGKLDLWKSSRNDADEWSKPVNLGDTINTPEDEMSPFIHHDNKTLYFASSYHPGMGGFDLFRTQLNNQGKFDTVINLGYPINTGGDEMGLIVNAKGDRAYYSSSMDPTRGRDIFQFDLPVKLRPDEVTYMKGKVYDDSTRVRLKAAFELFDLTDGSLISQAHSDERSGEFLLCIPTNRNYMLNVEKAGYLFYSDNFALDGIHHLEEPFLKDVPLQPIVVGRTIILKNIFFETDSYALRPESTLELNKTAAFLQLNPGIRVEISGHTDNIGSAAYNQSLSENRAKTVVNYLAEKGIDASRLQSAGYGMSQAIDSNDTPEGRANNRRTELEVLK